MSQIKKHDKGGRHDTVLVPNVGLKEKSNETTTCQQLREDQGEEP